MRASSTILVAGRVAEAEALWYDPSRWAAWVDGFGHLVLLDDPWPAAGARRVWDAPPGSKRGRVAERVLHHEARSGQRLSFEDARLEGEQEVAFAPEGGTERVRVVLTVQWRSKPGRPLGALADLTVVRRALVLSMNATLERFAIERRAEAELG